MGLVGNPVFLRVKKIYINISVKLDITKLWISY